MVANVNAFVDPAGKLRELPNLIGRKWVTNALPGWTVYLPPGKLAKWCRELEAEVVKVRVADSCGEGE